MSESEKPQEPNTIKPETVQQDDVSSKGETAQVKGLWALLYGQYELLMIAFGFFSRIPVPKNIDFSPEKMNQACRYFSLVGWFVALISSAVFYLTYFWLDVYVSTLLAMLTGVLLTGAFHEDGLMDSADGIGGGWTPEQKLRIMKDSRVGSYGAIAVWFSLMLKFYLLLQYAELLGDGGVMLAMLVAYPLSRGVATILMFMCPYVRMTDDSKVKAVTEPKKQLDLAICLLIASLGLVFIPAVTWPLALGLAVFIIVFRWFAFKQVGGITGDLLGLAQQLSELVIIAMLIVALQV